jgi:hypothetical protein
VITSEKDVGVYDEVEETGNSESELLLKGDLLGLFDETKL